MTERLRNTDSIECALEAMSPRELRRYITLWTDGSFDRFFQEANLCQEIAMRQIEAVSETNPGPELMEWIRTLETIDLAIEYCNALQMSLSFGCTPPDEAHFLDQ